MRIALVHSFYRESIPSGENHAVRLQAQALQEAGHDVQIISRRSDDLMTSKLFPLRSGLTVATGKGASPLDAIHSFRPDIVHVHNLFPNWSTDWVKRLNIPLVVTVHNFRPICAAGTLLRDGKFCDLCPTKGSHHAVLNSCYQGSAIKTIPLALATRKPESNPVLTRADGLIFLSDRSRKHYRRYGIGDGKQVRVISNFIEEQTDRIRPDLKNRKPRFIYVGRLSEEKGILPLVRHWPAGVDLDVVGSGPDEEACRKEAKGKPVFFHGLLSNDKTREMIHKSTGLIFPSVCQEAAPALVYLEALSAGIPTIAIKGNSVADDIGAFGTGVVVESLSGLEAAISEILRRSTPFRHLARERFRTRFAAEKWVTEMVSCYDDVKSRYSKHAK
jgi:glycosyltransferase involved in cell wall biosynthesis